MKSNGIWKISFLVDNPISWCFSSTSKKIVLHSFMTIKPGQNFEPERLPQDLLEKCAAVSVRQNAIKDLVEAMGGMVEFY
jgi:hypothetical protein